MVQLFGRGAYRLWPLSRNPGPGSGTGTGVASLSEEGKNALSSPSRRALGFTGSGVVRTGPSESGSIVAARPLGALLLRAGPVSPFA